MYLTLYVSILCIGLLEQVGKQSDLAKTIRAVFVWLILFILSAFNTWSPDYENYIHHFDTVEFGDALRTLEPGFTWIMLQLKAADIPFEGLLIFVGLITATCQTKILFSITKLPMLVFGCTYLLPLYPNIVQLRSFIAFSLINLAIVIQKKTPKISIAIALIAPLFHVGVMPLLPFLYLRRTNLITTPKYYFTLLVLSCLLPIIIPSEYVRQIMTELNPKLTALEDYSQSGFNTFILYSPILFTNILLITQYERSKKTPQLKSMEENCERKSELISIIKYATLTFPLVFVTRDFSRIIVNCVIFAYGYLGIMVEEEANKQQSHNKLISRLGLISFSMVLFASQNFLANGEQNIKVIQKTFESNLVFNNLFEF